MRKICIVTSNRADYWLLKPIIRYFNDSNNIDLQLIVSGAHLSERLGSSINIIKQDGFPIQSHVECLPDSDDHLGLVRAISQGVIGFSNALVELKPDLLLILGDRFEIFSAAQSAYCLKIPIAHLHGGELTFGALDEGFRHAISKFSQLHFVTHKTHQDRLVRMGENPDNIILSGAIGIDNMYETSYISKEHLSQKINFELKDYFLLTFHPTTLDSVSVEENIKHFSAIFHEYSDFQILITRSNPDPAGERLNQYWQAYRDKNPNRICLVGSLGQYFHSAVYYSRFVMGNSSSSIIEVPYIGKWAVDIGRRQSGRIISKNSTIHAAHDFESIKNAIDKVLNSNDPDLECPYGEPGTVLNKIVSVVEKKPLENILYKEFYEQ